MTAPFINLSPDEVADVIINFIYGKQRKLLMIVLNCKPHFTKVNLKWIHKYYDTQQLST